MKLYNLLKALEEMEWQMANLYKGFGEQFTNDSETNAVFKQLYQDEIEHKNIIAFLLRLVLNNPKEFSDLDQDAEEILEMIDTVKKNRLGIKDDRIGGSGFMGGEVGAVCHRTTFPYGCRPGQSAIVRDV
jgi:rubrerythrin